MVFTPTKAFKLYPPFAEKIPAFCVFLILIPALLFSQKTWDGGAGTSNWGDAANWSPDGVPVSTDNVLFNDAAGNVTVLVNGIYSCNDLTLNSNDNVTVQISAAGNSLTINGALTLNANTNKLNILDAATGAINVVGSVTFGPASGSERDAITVSTGTVTFTSAVTLLNNALADITFTGTGTINFNGGFTDDGAGLFTTVANCNVNFAGNYTNNNTAAVWDAASNAVFSGGAPTINPSAAITFGNVQVNSGITVTLGGNISISGNWTNNGGTLSGGVNSVTFSGTGKTIDGTGTTDFPVMVIGNGANYTVNNSNTCTELQFTASGTASSLTLDISNPTFTVNGDLILNQPITNGVTSSWYVNGGSGVVNGIITFLGGNTAARVSQVVVTTGTLYVDGTVNFDANTTDANQLITTSGSGTITFASSVITSTQADMQDGTLSVTGSGTMVFSSPFAMTGGIVSVSGSGTLTFNGAPAFSYNTGSSPTFTTNTGSVINFSNDMTALAALTFVRRSNSVFTGNSIITPTGAISFGNLQINSGITTTLAGNISVTGDWTNSGGTFAPSTYDVSFSGTGIQTITNTAGETFYSLTTNTTGPLTFSSSTDIIITSTLTMTSGNININGRTLTLGNSAAATLVRTTGIAYGGTFKRWFPTASISSSAAPLYGLFPIGTSSEYRPVAINSTADPTTAGYVSANHSDAYSTTDVTYTDNEGASILRIANMKSILSVSALAGGTYNIDVSFTTLSGTGVLTDLKLETYTGAVMGSVGTSAATTGSVSSPTVKRTALTATDLQNDWVIGSINVDPLTGTPIRQYYYSRKNGNWDDVTVGDGTWSYTSGGSGPSCDCIPVVDGFAVVSSGQTVSIIAPATVDFVTIENTATLDGTANLTVNKDLITDGSGKFTPTAGTWTITRNLTLVGTGSSSLSGTSSVSGNAYLGAGTILTMNGGSGLTISGNLTVDGTLALGTSTMILNGPSGSTISGSAGLANITGASATISVTTASKSISAGSNLTIAPTFAIVGAITITNYGTVTLTGNLTGSAAGSTWTNEASSTLNAGGTVLSTGILNASASLNTINYNAAGAQAIKNPSSSYYNLKASVSGTKSLSADVSVTGMVTIQNAAVIDEVSNGNDLLGGGGLTMTGTSHLIVRNGNIATTLPQLSGAYSITSGTVTITANAVGSTVVTIKGATYNDLIIDGGGNHDCSSLTTVLNDLTIGGTVDVTGNGTLTIGGDLLYSSTDGDGWTLTNNVTAATLTMTTGNTAISASSYNITITGAGGWTNNSTDATGFDPGTSTVLFTGTAAQTIGGSTSTTFYNLTINNTFGTSPQITVGITISANNILTMTAGNMNLSGFEFTIGTSAASPGSLVYTSGWMYGANLKRFFNTSTIAIGAAAGHFPIGTSSDYRPFLLAVNSPLTTGGSITLSHTGIYPADSIGTNFLDASWTYTVIAVTESYWTVSTSGVTAGGTPFDIRLEGTGLGHTANPWGAMNLSLLGSVVGTYSPSGGSGTNPQVNRTSLTLNELNNTGTSQNFRMGSRSSEALLPVTLLAFDAKLNGDNVELNWTTASETNNDYFTIERTTDGVSFSEVAQKKGAGNSKEIIDYTDYDHSPLAGTTFYRLKQTDFDGTYTYSQLVSVTTISKEEFSIAPNPVIAGSGSIPNFSLTGLGKEKEVLVVVYDMNGNESYSKVIITESTGSGVIAIDPSNTLKKGIYIVTATSDHKIYRQKLIIQ